MPGFLPDCFAARIPLCTLAGAAWGAHGATVIHIALLVLAVATLAFAAQPNLGNAAGHPLAAIFRSLSLTIGLPFLLLASTSPLLQLWLARREQSSVPWKLFALSNAGSLLALALYPSVIEPHLSLVIQRKAWVIGFAVYAVLCAVIAWLMRRSQMPRPDSRSDSDGVALACAPECFGFFCPLPHRLSCARSPVI